MSVQQPDLEKKNSDFKTTLYNTKILTLSHPAHDWGVGLMYRHTNRTDLLAYFKTKYERNLEKHV